MGKRIISSLLILMSCGYLYVCIELLFRQRSHIAMLFCASICAIPILLLNEWFDYNMYFIVQILICTIFCTLVELLFGYLFNSDYSIWDYRGMIGNIDGMICPLFTLFWGILSAFFIPLLDWIQFNIFDDIQRPYYIITRNWIIWMKEKDVETRKG